MEIRSYLGDKNVLSSYLMTYLKLVCDKMPLGVFDGNGFRGLSPSMVHYMTYG